jgi:hypothetical protein
MSEVSLYAAPSLVGPPVDDAGDKLSFLRRSLKLSPSESHIFKIVSQEVGPRNGFGSHVVADGRRPCEGARRCRSASDEKKWRAPRSKIRRYNLVCKVTPVIPYGVV